MNEPTSYPRKVALLCGGPSTEFVVSLTSARCCAHAIDRYRYNVRPFCILEDGSWVCPEQTWTGESLPSQIEKLFDLLDMPDYCPNGYFKLRHVSEGIRRLSEWQPDIVFPVMHGAWGEDGRLQGMLDILGVPFVGSGVLASALAMDKRRTCSYLGAHGIRIARHILLRREAPRCQREEQLGGAGGLLGWPIVVKPSRGGSSVGTCVAGNLEELYRATSRAFAFDSEVLLEEHVAGTEVTCGVLDLAEAYGGRMVCPPTEIRPRRGKFFDFDAKYRPGATDEITPAELPEAVIQRIQVIAEKAHDLLGCQGMSRTDMMVPEDGQPVFLETNTIPGMTPTSLLPQGAAALGISMTALLTGMIEGVFETLAVQRTREEQQ